MKTKQEIIEWVDLMLSFHPNVEDANFFNSIKAYLSVNTNGTNAEVFKETFGFDLDWKGDSPGGLGIAVCPFYECEEGNCDKCYFGGNWEDKPYRKFDMEKDNRYEEM